MNKQQSLGQHFLSSETVAKKIVAAAEITKDDVVLEIGTGKGILIPLLCKLAKKVISIEVDEKLYLDAKNQFDNLSNLKLIHADGFKTNENFSIFVSNLPYSQSRKAVEWLIQKKYARAVIMVQNEFAQKLMAVGKERRSVSILITYSAEIKKIMTVKKSNFFPPPKVESIVLKFRRKKTVSKELIHAVNELFSYRRKKLQTIFKQYGKMIELDKRLEELTNDEIIKYAKKIIKK